MQEPDDFQVFELADFELENGGTLSPAKLAYKTYGRLNSAQSNAIVYSTSFGCTHRQNEWLIGPDHALNPGRYFIIVPNMFGNGLSSSPSNTMKRHDGDFFPRMTIRDNIRAQHRLVTEHFGIKRLELVVGWRVGALQTYQWVVSYPDMVKRALPFFGAPKTSPDSFKLLEALKAALTLDAASADGFYHPKQWPKSALGAFARAYSGWELSQTFCWEQDANDLLAMLWTWKHADVGTSPGFDGDIRRALASIRAKTISVTAERDLYFPPENEKWAIRFIPDGEYRVIPGVQGQLAGLGLNPTDIAFADRIPRELLDIA